MNMVKANATSWAGYIRAGQYPGDVTNVVANDRTDTVTLSLDAAYGSYWFTYNGSARSRPCRSPGTSPRPPQLRARGAARALTVRVGSGSIFCDHRCAERRLGVREGLRRGYAFLTGKTEAGDLGTYATNPLWQIVDGPFRLTSFPRRDPLPPTPSCPTRSTRAR